MAPRSSFRKLIQGIEVCYDPDLDIISQDRLSRQFTSLNRTQVQGTFDLCAEITTWCNLFCQNCFSSSMARKQGIHLEYQKVHSVLLSKKKELVRFCITGGEPFLHPNIENFLTLPNEFSDLGCVLTTNGTLRPELDVSLIANNWLIAVSLHGREDAHNAYCGFDSFQVVRKRIESLAGYTRVHVYCVIHDGLTIEDIEWMLKFRSESGAKFLRFIVPRAFGRYRPLYRHSILEEIAVRLDGASGIKLNASKTLFLESSGIIRLSV
ncbi:radical SAM protein [Desulfopila sp. IMCC35006]|uniref:radical SAM protein n=1 Tax=Desulfopila sp. IMCC35006 TaxID=2569542 RepID=UPI0010AD33A8|nr:radical SAM protein [Desulfopila sp. IMCC35006]